jgi:hypothetical protein
MSEEERRAIGANNEAARRAIGTNNEAARRAIGINNEAERRGIGQRLIAERTGSTVEDLNRLVNPAATSQGRSLSVLEKRGSLTPTAGVGTWKEPARSTTSGIASPLKESPKLNADNQPELVGGKEQVAREYYDTRFLVSSDGVYSLELKTLKKLTMTDANNEKVEFQFLDPSVKPDAKPTS